MKDDKLVSASKATELTAESLKRLDPDSQPKTRGEQSIVRLLEVNEKEAYYNTSLRQHSRGSLANSVPHSACASKTSSNAGSFAGALAIYSGSGN